jgi:hypothetical protein
MSIAEPMQETVNIGDGRLNPVKKLDVLTVAIRRRCDSVLTRLTGH